jgi:hypothetical protein
VGQVSAFAAFFLRLMRPGKDIEAIACFLNIALSGGKRSSLGDSRRLRWPEFFWMLQICGHLAGLRC